MTFDQTLVVIILIAAIVVFATDRFRVDAVALSVLVTLVITGVLEADEALRGLSNPAVVTVFAVFILSGALVATGVADDLAALVHRIAGDTQWRIVIVLMLMCGLMSAFMNNIGATAILLPAALAIADRSDVPASKLLIPLAFASLLGGNITAIGTPPNILANGILSEWPGLEPFEFFEFAPTGIPVLLIGVAYMAVLGPVLLPARRRSGRMLDTFDVEGYLSTVTIGSRSSLVGLSLGEITIDPNHPVRIVAVRHRGTTERLTAHPSIRLGVGDRLTVQARLRDLAIFGEEHGGDELDVDRSTVAWTDPTNASPDPDSVDVIELMVAPDSTLIGSTLDELEFRRKRGVIALALRRRRGVIQAAIDHVRLRGGDSIVVTGRPDRLAEAMQSADFIPLHTPNLAIRHRRRAPIAIGVMAGVLFTSVAGLLPISIAMLTGAVVLVFTRTLTMDEAYASVDWKAIFLIAGMLPLGEAMEKTGTAELIATELIEAFGELGDRWVLIALYVLTAAITSVISNAATTVLIVPIAIDSALALGSDPRPFVMATVIAASTAFISPVGHQVNVLVYSPGNYRFRDFPRVGAGLTGAILVLTSVLVPIIWPF